MSSNGNRRHHMVSQHTGKRSYDFSRHTLPSRSPRPRYFTTSYYKYRHLPATLPMSIQNENGKTKLVSNSRESNDEEGESAAAEDNVDCKTTPTEAKPIDAQTEEMINESEEEYFAKALTVYDSLLKDLQVWCRLEAEKHYSQACWFERKSFYLEIAAAILCSVSLTGVGAFMTEWISSGSAASLDSPWSRIGVVGFGGVLLAGILEFLGKGSDSLLPTFQTRSEKHTQNAFSWQHLKHEIKATRLLLRNPNVDITKLDQKYRKHVQTRKELSEKVIVFTQEPESDLEQVKKYENMYLDTWPVDERFVPREDGAPEEPKGTAKDPIPAADTWPVDERFVRREDDVSEKSKGTVKDPTPAAEAIDEEN